MGQLTDIATEAIKIRRLLDQIDPKRTRLLPAKFPIMSCKLSSLLLCHHYLELWPSIEVVGVGGAAKDNDAITHYWLEVNGIAVDITGDQYNLIENKYLSSSIIQSRPYPSVTASEIEDCLNYSLFRVSYKDVFTKGLQDIHGDFRWNILHDYDLLKSTGNGL